MTTEKNSDATIVTIHCIPTGSYDDFALFVGENPFGPRGGRGGKVMDGECIARNLPFAEAVRLADEFIANHGAALLVLTADQQAGAERARKARQASAGNATD